MTPIIDLTAYTDEELQKLNKLTGGEQTPDEYHLHQNSTALRGFRKAKLEIEPKNFQIEVSDEMAVAVKNLLNQ